MTACFEKYAYNELQNLFLVSIAANIETRTAENISNINRCFDENTVI